VTSERSPGGVLGIAFRAPTHATSAPSMTIAAFVIVRAPSPRMPPDEQS